MNKTQPDKVDTDQLKNNKPTVAVIASHPIQYQAHWFKHLATEINLQVFYCHKATAKDQAQAGFDTPFDWDVDLLSGYNCRFLRNIARKPSSGRFFGCDTPEIFDALRVLAPDLVIVCGWYLKSFWQATVAAKRLGCMVAVRGDSHLGEPRSAAKQYAKNLLYPLGLRAFDVAMFVGQRSRDYLTHYMVPDSRLCFVPHCVDEAFFLTHATPEAGASFRRYHAIAPGDYVVAFAGKLISRKRVGDLIDVAAKLQQRGRSITVLVAGSGVLEESLRVKAKEQGAKTMFLGFQNQSQMPSVYAAANALALPSDNESWGLVANEALASGTPILISDAVGCGPDLAGDGRAGQLYGCGNIDDMADKLERMMIEPPSSDQIAEVVRTFGTATATSNVVALAHRAAARMGSSKARDPARTQSDVS